MLSKDLPITHVLMIIGPIQVIWLILPHCWTRRQCLAIFSNKLDQSDVFWSSLFILISGLVIAVTTLITWDQNHQIVLHLVIEINWINNPSWLTSMFWFQLRVFAGSPLQLIYLAGFYISEKHNKVGFVFVHSEPHAILVTFSRC